MPVPSLSTSTPGVRRLGDRYEARVRRHRGPDVSLGTFPTEWEAARARARYLATGAMPPRLPRWVRRVSKGANTLPPGYYAVVRAPGAKATIGPFADPDAAHRAAVRHLRRKLGGRAAAYLG